MLDFNEMQSRIEIIDQEDRALLRSNPSAWSMPEDGQGCMFNHMPLPSRSSFGCKAKTSLVGAKHQSRLRTPETPHRWDIGQDYIYYCSLDVGQ